MFWRERRSTDWHTNRPERPGYYWCFLNDDIDLYKIWQYDNTYDNTIPSVFPPETLFVSNTLAPVTDSRYDNAVWAGPIEPPGMPGRVSKETEITIWRWNLGIRRR